MGNYNLIRPCATCPFRSDREPFLRAGRVVEILRDLRDGMNFWCHNKLNDEGWSEDADVDERAEYTPNGEEEHCAGALILLEKQGRPNQPMRIMERLRAYNPERLDMKAPVYRSSAAMLRAHRRRA